MVTGSVQPIAVNIAFCRKLRLNVPNALRQLHVGNFRVFRRNADLFTVEVVTSFLFDLPGQIKVMLVLLKIKSKGLIRNGERPGASNNPAKTEVLQSSRMASKDALSHER